MKRIFTLLDINLALFDGAAGAGDGGNGGNGAAGDGSGGGTRQGVRNGTGTASYRDEKSSGKAPLPQNRRGKSGELANVVYGKQATDLPGAAVSGNSEKRLSEGNDSAERFRNNSDAGSTKKETDTQTTSNTLEEKRAKFRELVCGEYKDIYTQETQRMIDKRFKETKGIQEQLDKTKPVIDTLMMKYGIEDGNVDKLTAAIDSDDTYWSEAAEKAGMTPQQYKEFTKLQRENAALKQVQAQERNQQQAQAQLQKWYAEGEQVRELYPDFDLAEEVKDRNFLAMLKAGVPVQHAYEVTHLNDIKNGIAQTAAKNTEKKVVDNIRAKGARPVENGISSQSGITLKSDVSKLTRADRAEIARRVGKGEVISF